MIHTQEQLNSESALMQSVFKLSDAGAAVIQVRTREAVRTALVLRKSLVNSTEAEYREWDCINGFRTFTREDFTANSKGGDGLKNFIQAIDRPMTELRTPSSPVNTDRDRINYYVFVNPHPFMRGNPIATEYIQQYAAILPATNVCIILVTPDVSLDDIPSGNVLVADLPTPNPQELAETLHSLLEKSGEDFADGVELDEDDVAQVAQMGLGLTLFEFETYAALGIVDAGIKRAKSITAKMMLDAIAVGKTEVIKQSEILELYPTVDMSEVGGMKRLRDWVKSRKDCFSDEAREFGIEHPKGIMTAGVPGTGKSLIAKAIASEMGIPLVRLDMGKVFSKFIGDSEGRIRSALKMAEAMAPCVLFVDEIDKGLGGAGGGGGDSGTSSRVLGTYLTWLNDCKAPVFNMVTANKVEGLPPELLRKGRFDQIFSVGLPTKAERREVLSIHLRKRGHEMTFAKQELSRFDNQSEGYVPAEIEAAVRDALILAFNAKEALGMDHIVTALKEMVPMSKSNAEQINAILAWANENAVPVNYPETAADIDASLAPLPVNGTRRLRSSRGAA